MKLKLALTAVSGFALLAMAAHAQTPPNAAVAPAESAAPTAPAAPAPVAPATPAAPAAAVSEGHIPPPPAGKGQIVFFRKSSISGMAVSFTVKENGVGLGNLSNGAYFVKVEDAGPHTFTAATENKNVLHLEVDDGETYYVKGSIQMGFMIGEANISPSDQATFDKAYKGMHLAKPPTPEKAADADKR